MTRTIASAEISDPNGGYVVRRPRATDAIGKVLRGAFGRDEIGSPGDLDRLIRRIDRVADPA